METYINNNVNDITYQSELILDVLKILLRSKMSRIKFAQITYVRYRSVSYGLI